MNRAAVLLLLLACVVPACGKKGPPRPPLRLVPAAPSGVVAARRGGDVYLRFTVPAANQGGEGRLDLQRVEIYAITLAGGAPEPANRDLLSKRFLAGTIEVKPPAAPAGEQTASQATPAPEPAAADTRPAPGESATFVETLTPELLAPATMERARDRAAVGQSNIAAWLQEPAKPPYPSRMYVIRGVTRGGRPGPPSTRMQVPLIDPPPPPSAVAVSFTEHAVTISWTPPEIAAPAAPPVTPRSALTLALAARSAAALAASATGAPAPPALLSSALPPAPLPPVLGFTLYEAGAATPITSAPIAASTYDRAGVQFGTEQCFVVRTVQTLASVSIESAPSEPACVTPLDKFPPQAPKGLTAVAGTGVVNLIWDVNTEADLGGYLVLRGEAPGDTLQALTPEPIRETSFRDATVKPGVRYVYAVVAVDRSSPPNRSGESPRVEETAR